MTTQPQSPSPRPSNPAAILDTLVRAHGAELRAQAARHAPDPDAACDAFQDAAVEFLRYYKGPPGADALRCLMLIVKQRAWALGAEQRQPAHRFLAATDLRDDPEALAIVDERPGPAALTERHQEHDARRATLGRLKLDERRALLLQAAGYSYEEIAARHQWTFTKASRCIREGRAALRQSARA